MLWRGPGLRTIISMGTTTVVGNTKKNAYMIFGLPKPHIEDVHNMPWKDLDDEI